MGDGPSRPPKPTPARFAIAENLRALMEIHQLKTPRDLERVSGASYKTVQRLLKPYDKHSPNLDSLDEIAYFFKIDTFKLLVRRRMNPLLVGEEPRGLETQSARIEIPSKVRKSHVKKA